MAFSIGQSRVKAVSRYIANQKQHHRKQTFQGKGNCWERLFVAFSDATFLRIFPGVPLATLASPQALMFVAFGDRTSLIVVTARFTQQYRSTRRLQFWD